MTVIRLNVGTIEVRALGTSRTRTSVVIYNNHATQIVYWSDTKGVAAANGFPIAPSGGSISLKIPEDDPTQPVFLVANGADTDVRIYEGYGQR